MFTITSPNTKINTSKYALELLEAFLEFAKYLFYCSNFMIWTELN